MKVGEITSSGGRTISDRIGRRSIAILLVVGLLVGAVAVGGVGLTSATDDGARAIDGVEGTVVDLLDIASDAGPNARYGGGGASITNGTGTLPGTAPETTPHAGPEPLTDLRPDASDPGVSTMQDGNVTALAIETQIHERINEIRRQHGLDPLEFSATLATHGRAHSYDMDDRDYFAHKNPDGESPADRIPNAFAHCTVVGENLHYRTWGDAEAEAIANAAVEAWMNSKSHRENLLREDWTIQGIGVYIGSTDDGVIVYSSQEFCAP